MEVQGFILQGKNKPTMRTTVTGAKKKEKQKQQQQKTGFQGLTKAVRLSLSQESH